MLLAGIYGGRDAEVVIDLWAPASSDAPSGGPKGSRSQAGPLPVRSVEQKLEKCRWYVIGLRERVRKSASCHLESLVIVPTIITRDALTASSPVYLSFALHPQNYFPTSVVGSGLEVIIRVVLGRRNMLSLAGPDSSISHHSHLAIAPDRRAPLGAIE